MKKLTKLLSFILAISMLLCISASAVGLDYTFELTGQLGDDVYYSYDKDTKVLRIYGTGATYDFDGDPGPGFPPEPNPNYSPLYFCNEQVSTVIVENGITYLGSELLCGIFPKQIIIAESVTAANVYFFRLSSTSSIYFYGNAPAIVDNYGEPSSIHVLYNDPTIYHLLNANGWDKFDIKKFDNDKLEYVPETDHLKTFCGAPYSDVAGDAWCAEAVLKMWEEGIMNGTELDYFSPDASLTRGMMATILYRMAGEPEYIGGAGSYWFADVGEGSFCDKAIGWAHANGIIEGYTDGSFKPDRALNRQELAALLYRYDTKLNPATTTDGDTVSSAPDASKAADWDTVSSFAKEAMLWAVKEGIINGTDSTKLVLSPFGTASRAQIAVMLSRYLA